MRRDVALPVLCGVLARHPSAPEVYCQKIFFFPFCATPAAAAAAAVRVFVLLAGQLQSDATWVQMEDVCPNVADVLGSVMYLRRGGGDSRAAT